MKFFGSTIAMAVAAGAITFAAQREAHGELVFDEDLNAAPEAVQMQQPSQVRDADRKEMTKSEMIRRQRMREEMKNEDILSQKLEELRLKEEMRLTDRLLGSATEKSEAAAVQSNALPEQKVGSAAAEAGAVAQTAVMQQPMQVATVNSMAMQPMMTQPMVTQNSGMVAATMPGANMSTTTMAMTTDSAMEPVNRVTITPRVGTSSITNSIYDVSAKFAVGGVVSVDVSEHIAFTGAYTFASYNLGPGNSIQAPVGYGYGYQQLVLNDNEFDGGMRAFFLTTKSMVRPYVGAGLGYRKAYINFDDKTQSIRRMYDPYSNQDLDMTGFTGFLETGMDFRISKGIALSGTFRYFDILSARQSIPLHASAFGNPYSGAYYGGISYDPRIDVSNALAKNNFYQLMVGVSVTF